MNTVKSIVNILWNCYLIEKIIMTRCTSFPFSGQRYGDIAEGFRIPGCEIQTGEIWENV